MCFFFFSLSGLRLFRNFLSLFDDNLYYMKFPGMINFASVIVVEKEISTMTAVPSGSIASPHKKQEKKERNKIKRDTNAL